MEWFPQCFASQDERHAASLSTHMDEHTVTYVIADEKPSLFPVCACLQQREQVKEWILPEKVLDAEIDDDAETAAPVKNLPSDQKSEVDSAYSPSSLKYPSKDSSQASELLLEQEEVTAMIQEVEERVGLEIKPWKPDQWVKVGVLSEAPRNYGTVVEMSDLKGNGFAVKRMPNKWVRKNHSEFLMKAPGSLENPWRDIATVTALSKLGCEFVLETPDIFRDKHWTYVVYQLASEGDLFQWSVTCKANAGLDRELLVKPIASQVFEALRMLHDLGIAHGDLSLENVLLTETCDGKQQVKLIDFGMSLGCQIGQHTARGKLPYQAPEVHTTPGPYDSFLWDAFAAGVLLFGLVSKDYPWADTDAEKCKSFRYISLCGMSKFLQVRKVSDSLLRAGADRATCLDQVFSTELKELLLGMLDVHPQHRWCLGENCYLNTRRASVWKAKWLMDPPILVC